jgi:hypothetical protein
MTSSSLASVRAVTTSRRPPGNHGCPGVEIIPGLWTAHFHDIETTDALRAVAPPVTVVVNVGTDKCPVVSYGGACAWWPSTCSTIPTSLRRRMV